MAAHQRARGSQSRSNNFIKYKPILSLLSPGIGVGMGSNEEPKVNSSEDLELPLTPPPQ